MWKTIFQSKSFPHERPNLLFYGAHKNEWETNLKIKFATNSRINGVQKSVFSEISKKKAWDKSKKHFCPSLFSLQFLKPKRLLSRPLFSNDHLFFLWSLVFSETKNVSSKDKMMTTEPHFC